MDSSTSFGAWLRRHRKALDITQTELADRAGCVVGTIRSIEGDVRRPSRQLAARLADELQLDTDARTAFINAARGLLSADQLPMLPRTAPSVEPSTPLAAPRRAFNHARIQLPAQPTALIGRKAERAELDALLENPACRLITIVGPGGIGKTRLALAAAERAVGFVDGAVFVPLAAISNPAFIAPTILTALEVPLQSERDPRTQLLDLLRPKTILLVLDNLEQLLVLDTLPSDAATALLSELLAHAPGITLLATSRERLGIASEWLYDLGGLNTPAEATILSVEASSAGQLFVQRAQQIRRQFALTDGETRAVARICQLVEGMPLAIELAAAALRSRTCAEIAEAIERDLATLTAGLRMVPERHRSIIATFEHSWRLLSEEERSVFARLSVFHGGFVADAAVHVAQATILGSLALLVSLLVGAAPAQAQQRTCFAETGHCIGGRFAQYWQQNGSLAVFGYPLTDELTEQGRTVQYFERQRFELHNENAAPYDVLLGLLGEEILQQQGTHSHPIAPGPLAGCLWFPQTHHNVCDQVPNSGFKQYWTTHGLEFDGRAGKSYQESLALFGLPVSEPFQQSINGEMLEVQWFERARFEWHPGNADPYRVLLGRLGAEVQSAAGPTPSILAYASQDSPAEVLASFYNAVGRYEYQRAYGYWESPPSSYDQFVQGYADTASVQLIVQPPTFIDAGAGNLHTAIPTVLVATKRDGSTQRFGGCYVTHKANIQLDVWHLSQAQIAPLDASASIPTLLAGACAAFGVPAPAQVSYADQNTPVDLLASFYNAINRQDHQRAFSYWESPPSPYDQFAQGYADTASVQLIVQLPAFIDAGAGNLYAAIPTVLVATKRDGSQQSFVGCYTTHKANIQPDVWHLARATVAPAPPSLDIPSALAQACAT
jgi:predicted ATPase/transcriptional regulator with XRE-family HTH domain